MAEPPLPPISALDARPARDGWPLAVPARVPVQGLDGPRWVALPLLALALAGAALVGLGAGAMEVPPARVGRVLLAALGLAEAADGPDAAVVLAIRAPRVLSGALIGAALAVSGALMQGLFRNPLADPQLLGVSTGAGLGAAAVIVLGAPLAALLPPGLQGYAVALGAFAGALAAVIAVVSLGRRGGRLDTSTTLLAGVAISAISGAAMGVLLYLADDAQLRDITFWTLGSVGGATWPATATLAVLVLPCLLATLGLGRAMNAMLLGDAAAHHLGVPVARVRRAAILATTLAVGASVALAGSIGFVGLVVPHLARLVLGPDHRLLLPAATLGGATLLVLADTLARTVAAPTELPIGILTTLLGGPFFVWLLRRGGRGGTRG